MIKYFLRLIEWLKIKTILIDAPQKNHFFKEREVWWCSIGLNIGDEEFGKGPQFLRPVLIFKKFSGNSFLGLPLTGTIKEGSWYAPSTVLGKTGSVMLNQARMFDGRRLVSRMTVVTQNEFKAIQTKFRELYCPINV
jgi:mRNA-degrading endonuclease toxin of MazEF toxin-antitoxin module